MDDTRNRQNAANMGEPDMVWQTPDILEEGQIEAKLFSDEPDPWGGP
jgi:hypothetical protein